MKSLKEIILEKKLTDKQQLLVGEYVVNLFKGSKLSKDKIKDMLKSLSINDIQPLIEIEEYIEKIDKKNSFPYLVSKDDFLKKDNYEKIIDNFAQYIEKYIGDREDAHLGQNYMTAEQKMQQLYEELLKRTIAHEKSYCKKSRNSFYTYYIS